MAMKPADCSVIGTDRFPLLFHQHLREPVLLLLYRIGKRQHSITSLRIGGLRPGLERLLARCHSLVDIIGRRNWNFGIRLACGRIDAVASLARRRELAVDHIGEGGEVEAAGRRISIHIIVCMWRHGFRESFL